MNAPTVPAILPSDLSPTEISGGDRPMATRSQGLMTETGRPAVITRNGETDVWQLAARLAHAKDRTAMQATCNEIRALSQAVLDLVGALVACRATDRSEPYATDEARPDGAVPQPGQRWRTPRLIVDHVIGWEEPKP